jgi:putative ABC transport system permease protein
MPVWLAATTLASRPLRSVLNVCAVVIAIVAAIVSVSIVRSIDVVVRDPANAGDPADASMAPPDGLDPAHVERALGELPGVAAWFSFADDRATVDGHDVHVRAIGGDPTTNGFVVGGGRRSEGAGEAMAGFGLMRQLGWQIGDRVEVQLADDVVHVEIVGWYRETEDSGRILQIRMEDYARLRPGAVPSYGVIGTDQQTPQSVAAALASVFGPRFSIEPNDAGGTDLSPFRAALAAMTSMIAAVAVAHLVTSVVTTSRERARRFAIQRAIGFDGRRLTAEAISHGLLVATLAALVGVPAGWYAQRAIGDLITRQVGAGPGLSIGPSPTQLALIVGATLVLVAATTMLATRPTR